MSNGMTCTNIAFGALLALIWASAARVVVVEYSDRTAFEAAASGLANIGFEGIAPIGGCTVFRP